jgi:predicted RND superfamily exporter protein
MRRIAQGILKHQWLVLSAFAVALIVSFLASQSVKINFKLTDYLPDSAEPRGDRMMRNVRLKASQTARMLEKYRSRKRWPIRINRADQTAF